MNAVELRAQITVDLSRHWQNNDNAHRAKHFMAVQHCGELINARLNLQYDHRLIMMAAFFHDLFAWSRHNHHLLSAEWVKTTDYPMVVALSGEDRALLEHACREHRASFTGNFTTQFSELINAADREVPGDVEGMLNRAIHYRLAKEGPNRSTITEAIAHLKEKFGYNGYARYPAMYIECFDRELDKQRQDIMNL